MQRLIDQVIDANSGVWPSNDFRCRAQKTFITRDEFEARVVERRNKPSWDKAPAWARYVAQDSGGRWYWYDAKPVAVDEEFGIEGMVGKALYSFRYGEVIGDWRNTPEQRPNHIGESDEKGCFDFEALANQFDDADDINAVWALRDKLHHKNKPEPPPELSFHLSTAFNELQAGARLLPDSDPRRAQLVALAGGVSAVKEVV